MYKCILLFKKMGKCLSLYERHMQIIESVRLSSEEELIEHVEDEDEYGGDDEAELPLT